MPNHIHLLWEILDKNGKEMAYAAFQKFTAHEILKQLTKGPSCTLQKFYVNEPERLYRIWQDNPYAIRVIDKNIAERKLEYIHLNPLQPHWNLVDKPEDYLFSSANFYEEGKLDYPFLTHYKDRF